MNERIYCIVEDAQAMPDGTIRGTARVADPSDAPRWSALLSVKGIAGVASLGYIALTDAPIDPACHVYELVTGVETTAPPEDAKPNHVRDAVRANS